MEDNIEFYKNIGSDIIIYHALLEYIKSGEAIPYRDMGHPDFSMGYRNYKGYKYSTHKPSSSLFKVVQYYSEQVKDIGKSYIWYRDLSSWEKYCQFVIEQHYIKIFERRGKTPKHGYEYYIRHCECPACGTKKYSEYSSGNNNINIKFNGKYVQVKCSRCHQFRINKSAFQYLDTYEKKAKLSVFLMKNENYKTIINKRFLDKHSIL
ncbi:MAG: hypothetical protein U9O95_09455 [Candidatus Marinimicrobia bacterium]|nr:hypothetical protein [Candidatus Neomarinimicrobiota bacterium]